MAPPRRPQAADSLEKTEWSKAEALYKKFEEEGQGFSQELWEMIGGDDQGSLEGLFTKDGVVPLERWKDTLIRMKAEAGA